MSWSILTGTECVYYPQNNKGETAVVIEAVWSYLYLGGKAGSKLMPIVCSRAFGRTLSIEFAE